LPLLAGLALGGCGGAVTPATGDEGPQPLATQAAEPAVVRPEPVSIRIPAIGVQAEVGGLGLNADDTVEVPTDPDDAGWYSLGPSPGEAGSAVILGHVDSKSGPAVFAGLKRLRAGNRILVTMSDRSIVRYAVTGVSTYPNAKFPARRVYGATGTSTLNLVTCGGKYDTRIGYLSNVVAYASILSAR
jgi:sortase (surface protein transpeptidase)